MTLDTVSLGLVGTTIAGKYAVESVVGHGGFATVFRAQHILWKRPVALKVFTALGAVAEDQRQKLLDDFIQEGALLAELSEKSTAIVQARDIGTLVTANGDSVPYMVLEWLDGQTLEDVLSAERANAAPLRSLEAAVRLLDPVAEALALAHSKGIAHRDVKPANVFVLGADGEAGVKLLDFGIAKVVQDVQKMGFAKTSGDITSFTPLYGAPEQFNRSYGSTGPWTDVFALALVLGEIVAGKEPMSGDTLVQLAYAAADEKTRPTPRTLGVTVSDEIEAIFHKALAVKPEERWQSVGHFWNALRIQMAGDRRTSLVSTVAVPSVVSSSSRPSSPAAALGLADTCAPSEALTRTADTVNPHTPSKSRRPLFVGLSLAVLALGGGAFAFRANSSGDKRSMVPDPPAVSAPSAKANGGASASAVSSPMHAASAMPAPSCPKEMIFIPGGEYFMGSDEKDALDTEKPAHRVKLAPYCIDEHEMTVARYKDCSDRGACRRAGRENVWPGIKDSQRKIYDPLCNIRDPEGRAQHPINCIDWDQARDACESIGGRLPTEAEWEFAARGPDGRIYPWGDEAPNATFLNACGKECIAWQKKFRDPETTLSLMYDEDDGFPNTAPVGTFPKGKSRYGVQDVVGNVWEWVADYYDEYATAASPVTDPKGPTSGTHRVIRGGAWNGSTPSWVRPSFRFHVAPSARSYGFGVRCAKSV